MKKKIHDYSKYTLEYRYLTEIQIAKNDILYQIIYNK